MFCSNTLFSSLFMQARIPPLERATSGHRGTTPSPLRARLHGWGRPVGTSYSADIRAIFKWNEQFISLDIQLSTWFKNSTRMNWLASPRYAVMTKIESFLLPLRWNLFIYSCVAIFGCDERICPIGMSQRYPQNMTCRLGSSFSASFREGFLKSQPLISQAKSRKDSHVLASTFLTSFREGFSYHSFDFVS